MKKKSNIPDDWYYNPEKNFGQGCWVEPIEKEKVEEVSLPKFLLCFLPILIILTGLFFGLYKTYGV